MQNDIEGMPVEPLLQPILVEVVTHEADGSAEVRVPVERRAKEMHQDSRRYCGPGVLAHFCASAMRPSLSGCIRVTPQAAHRAAEHLQHA